ncbi:MAG TPA: hypothetical protein VM033_04185 [Gemmatimonadaceae bacterium]|nr:hypothetical protein [Gemmatimonadaceae bacterium]
MKRLMTISARLRRMPRILAATSLVLAFAACSNLLDVTNPNNVNEDALDNPAAAGPLTNGALASLVRMLSAVTVPYSVATDELDWIGSRDAWFDLETGGIANYLNEFTDGAFPYVGESRYLGDLAITKLEGFNTSGALTDKLLLARAYLYTAIVYTTIADMYDDYAFSNKIVAAAPIGRANMGTLYDKAVGYLDKAQTIAAAGSDNALKYNVLAYRARVKHAKAVWSRITPKGQTPASSFVSDAGANADAAAAIALGSADQKFNLTSNLEATAGINIWFEVNGRNEHRVGTVYTNLIDPVSGTKDATATALLAQFKAFGTQSGVFTITSTRELRLILAEAALVAGNVVEFQNQINVVRALDAKPAFVAQVANDVILKHERQAQLWLMRRRLSDMYRFGQKDAKWANNPNFESAFSVPGLLFPIPNVERLGNPCIKDPTLCK